MSRADRDSVDPCCCGCGGIEGDAGERVAWELHWALSELVRVYQFRDRSRVCYYDVSVTQCYALSTLARQGTLNLNALAAELYLDKSTASRVVDALVDRGYATRSIDPHDARAVRLEVTDRGRELHHRIERDLVEELKPLLTDLDPATRESTVVLITRLARLAAERFNRGRCCASAQ